MTVLLSLETDSKDNPVILPQHGLYMVCSPLIFPICLKTSLYSDCQKIRSKMLNSPLLAQ